MFLMTKSIFITALLQVSNKVSESDKHVIIQLTCLNLFHTSSVHAFTIVDV